MAIKTAYAPIGEILYKSFNALGEPGPVICSLGPPKETGPLRQGEAEMALGQSDLCLFDEFHLPKRVAVAHVQGLRGHNVHQGDLPTLKSVSSTTSAVEMYRLGHRLRWLKQMALRGRGGVTMSTVCAARCDWWSRANCRAL